MNKKRPADYNVNLYYFYYCTYIIKILFVYIFVSFLFLKKNAHNIILPIYTPSSYIVGSLNCTKEFVDKNPQKISPLKKC